MVQSYCREVHTVYIHLHTVKMKCHMSLEHQNECENDTSAVCENDTSAVCENDTSAVCENDTSAVCENDTSAVCENDTSAVCVRMIPVWLFERGNWPSTGTHGDGQ